MDYKEKYEMALERAKKFIEGNPLVQNLNTWIKETFPELKESEDERIREHLEQAIQQHIKDCLDIKFPTTDVKMIAKDVEYTARMFFELGLNARKENEL